MAWNHIISEVVNTLVKKKAEHAKWVEKSFGTRPPNTDSNYVEKCGRDLRLITDAIQNDLDNPMLNGAFTKRAGYSFANAFFGDGKENTLEAIKAIRSLYRDKPASKVVELIDKMVDIIKTQTNYWDTIIKTRTQTFIFNDILPDRRIIDKILWEMHEHCPSKQRKAPYRIDVLDWSNQQLRRDIYAGTYTPDKDPDRFNSQTLAPYLLVFSKRNLTEEEIGINDELNDWVHFHNVAWNEIGMASTFIALSALSKGIDSGFCACIRNAKEICKEFPNMEQKDGPLLYMGLGYRSNAKTYMCPIKGTEEEIFGKDWLHKGVVHDRKPPFQKYIGFNEYK